MSNHISRRAALGQLGKAGAGIVLAGGAFQDRITNIVVAGKPVEIVVASLSPTTVRLTVLPIDSGRTAPVPDDGALVREDEGRVLATRRSREAFDPIRAGNLLVRFDRQPLTITLEKRTGQVVQRLTLDAGAAGMAFLLSKGPLLALGQGGPQFDRKGTKDAMRSGQGGDQLGTHGGCVPIQWLVGTDGWGMFVHHPLGSFDFSGAEGKFTPSAEGLPLDIFVVSSSDPAEIMRAYAHITGFAEMPALWLHYPDDPIAAARGDQYLWGRDVLVSPVVEKGAASRRLYLPRGTWFDFWTDDRVEGGREIDRKVDLATMPLHVHLI
jgi:alpha-glucosidase